MSETSRDDAEAALAARRELGLDFEQEIVDSFADRVEKAIAVKVSDEVERQVGSKGEFDKHRAEVDKAAGERRTAIGVVSLIASIPLSIVVGEKQGIAGLLIVWIGIVLVNLAFAFGSSRRHRE